MTNDESTYREILEADYDRPSFHCGDWSHQVIGRKTAIMDQHQDLAHKSVVDAGGTFLWRNERCGNCGFDAGATFRETFPELTDIDQWQGSGQCDAN